jgi:predicted O-methyltransferase YrrM
MFPPQVQKVLDKVDRLREQVDDHFQIAREEALLLAQLVRIGRCISICEVGTSYGFSTLHLAAATREYGGHVHTFEINDEKAAAATRHIQEAGLADVVTLHQGDARALLPGLEPQRPFDFVFIDAVKIQSLEYLDAAWPSLALPCVLVTDNTITHAEQLAPFIAHLRSLPNVVSCGVPVGDGFELTVKRC